MKTFKLMVTKNYKFSVLSSHCSTVDLSTEEIDITGGFILHSWQKNTNWIKDIENKTSILKCLSSMIYENEDVHSSTSYTAPEI